MTAKSLLVPVLAVLVGGSVAWAAAPGPLDLIPADAAAALTIRNITSLKKKGDKLLNETRLKIPIRPSQAFEFVYTWLGINAGVDENAPAGILIANPAVVGAKKLQDTNDSVIVVMVPFTDADKMAGNFMIKPGALKQDVVVKGKAANFGEYFCAHGKHIFFGKNEKAVLSVVRGKKLAGQLSAAEVRGFGSDDILLYLGQEAWSEIARNGLPFWRGNNWYEGMPEEDKKELGMILKAFEDVHFGMLGIGVGNGLGLRLLTRFTKDPNFAARKLLRTLGAGAGGSDLGGLPEGPVIAAQSGRGSGQRNVAFARLLASWLMNTTIQSKWLPAAADRPNFLGVFTEVWQQLEGRRIAIYKNAEETKLGLFSVVAILKPADPKRFLRELRQLARLAGEKLDLTGEKSKDDLAEVDKLIAQLADDSYKVRESATLKLALIGEPLLPRLEKATTSPDPEVRRRGNRIKARIVSAARARRQELLSKDVTKHVHPQFAYLPKAQKVEGKDIDVLKMKLEARDAAAAAQLKQLFGPHWDKIRLAVQGDQVVVLLGSDEKLLAATLKNLKEKKPGLAGAKALAGFGRQANPQRVAEFHLSVETVLDLARAADLRRPAKQPAALTSFALTVGKDRIEVSAWLPLAEVAAIAREIGPQGGF